MRLADLITDVNNSLTNRTASIEAIAPVDPALLKTAHIFVLGPAMIAAGMSTRPLSKWVRWSLLVGGLATILKNLKRAVE